ncbi:MAG TPA: LptF/LptG family permease, partial [Alphaproteobacteria bacterium]|nr:LptF/LptG family permease [Alphaproteobacteria bacterium]
MTGTGTLFRYISRHFLFNFLGLTLILLGLVYVFDSIELLRRAAERQNVPFGLVLRMAAMKLPQVGQKIIPF